MSDAFLGFWGWAAQRPEAPAVVEAQGRTVSFGALAAATNQVARGLQAQGLGLGDGVAALMPNCVEMLEICLGAMQAGLYFTAINNHLAVPEIAHVLDNCEAGVLIIHERYRAQAIEALTHSAFPVDKCLWVGEGEGGTSYEAFKAAQSIALPEIRAAGQMMIYSSGTTGKPKGIRPPLPKAGPDSAEAARAFSVALFGFRPGDGVHLVNGPLHHSGPITFAVIALYFGHKTVVIDKWDAELSLSLIEQHRVTNTFMVPTMFTRMLKLPEERRAAYDLSSLEVLIHAAAPCPPPVKHAMIDWLGPILFESYGGTEGAGTTCNSQQWLTKPGTVGPPAPNVTVKIYDDAGNVLPAREIGTVYLSASMGIPQYFKDPEKTAEAVRGDLYTIGDMGYLDEDGWLFLVDRKSDMLISGGVNIYPAEIEQILVKHPAVRDAAVFGIPSEEWGEEVKAVVQINAGHAQDDALVQDILGFCGTQLARYKIPRSVDFIDEMPRSDNGKLYKRQLKEPYWAGHDTRI